MNFNDLQVFCKTDTRTRRLCQNKNFWIQKMIYDGLTLPNKELLDEQTNWIKAYYMLRWITDFVDPNDNELTTAIINTDNIVGLQQMILKYNLPSNEDENWIAFEYRHRKKGDYIFDFVGKNNEDFFYYSHSIYMSYDELFNFLFDAMMNDVIVKLEETYIFNKGI